MTHPLVDADRVTYLDPRAEERALFEAVIDGWINNMVNRHLAATMIESKVRIVRRLGEWVSATYGARAGLPWQLEMPWRWERHHGEAWIAKLRRDDTLDFTSARQYQGFIRQFNAYLCDPLYPWARACAAVATPAVIFDEHNSIRRPKDDATTSNARPPYSREQLNDIFAFTLARAKKAHGKQIWPAMRDAVVWRFLYAYGVRNEGARGVTLDDFSRNPFVGDYGDFGGVCVTEKGARGAGPRTRLVRTVPEFEWIVTHMRFYLKEIRPNIPGASKTRALFPSERGAHFSETYLCDRWSEIRTEMGLDEKLVVHSYRHSYMTHLLEAGYPAKFVQMQVGHEHLGSMRTYTKTIGDEFAKTCLRNAHQNAFKTRTPEQAQRLICKILEGEDLDE